MGGKGVGKCAAGGEELLSTRRPHTIYYQTVQTTEIPQMIPRGISWPYLSPSLKFFAFNLFTLTLEDSLFYGWLLSSFLCHLPQRNSDIERVFPLMNCNKTRV